MATPLKELYDEPFLRTFALRVRQVAPDFQTDEFVSSVMDESWETLELKARTRQIAIRLGEFLPNDYEAALGVLFAITDDCVGFPYLFFPDFVVVYGQDEKYWDESMRALERFTQTSSAEFAIRPFLIRDRERGMRQMTRWATHPNEHVRRLASEGCRPRLPWAEALPDFKRDPSLVFTILELLKEDESLYVRKSVANNLNDISKDHPDAVLERASRWKGGHPHTDWIIRHGCRTLVKAARPEALALFGYALEEALAVEASIQAIPDALTIGESGAIQYELRIRDGDAVYIRVEYAIDFVKATGKIGRKAFLLANKRVAGGTKLSASRTHKWSDLSTRRHHPGVHRIVLLLNGQEVAETSLALSGTSD